MRDYTYQDMLKMQEDAANRVREMKKRAAIVVEDEHTPQKTSLPDEVKHISYPVELNTNGKCEQIDQNKNNSNGLIELISKDKDVLLILALLFVMNDTEECDRLISLALLYLLF